MLRILFFIPAMNVCACLFAQHPTLGITKAGIELINSSEQTPPIYEARLSELKAEVDQAIKQGIEFPIPKDMAGGHSHQTHKSNYKLLEKAGNLFQITSDKKYSAFVKSSLYSYTDLYMSTGLHPSKKSYARGKLFWQCLNDANWLVGVSQAYDCIYDSLEKKERQYLEENLFIPYANFLSIDNPRFFNRIHNHSTWANAAVGMMALAMDNDTLLNKALYGLDNGAGDPNAEKRDAGFLAQLDYSFSPDGYFSEGPYYQRYAIFPFLVFSNALHNSKPELKIFEYRDSILAKATMTTLNLTNAQGAFFPINDAQKGMDYNAYEIVTAVNTMYYIDNTHQELLRWAAKQDAVLINEAGYTVARDLAKTKISEPEKKSVNFNDGVSGDEGGLAVLRKDAIELVFKYTSQGMGHGHFDRLSYALFDDAGEVIQDYGAVRWVNVDQKGGGRYLPENKTFGKQTIAHNALVLDQESHFMASVKKAEKSSPELYFFDNKNEDFQIASAVESNAYSNTTMQRTFMILDDESFKRPLILDLMNVDSEAPHSMDLPLWYTGQILKTNSTCETATSQLNPLGDDFGYQHIWLYSACQINKKMHFFNWLSNDRFYTMYSVVESGDTFVLGRAGANDPNHNLRPDPVLIQRRSNVDKTLFVNVIESHGEYNRSTEGANKPYGSLTELKVDYKDKDHTSISFVKDDFKWKVFFSNNDSNEEKKHTLTIDDEIHSWTGPYNFKKSKV